MSGIAGAAARLISYPVGVYVGAMGVWLMANAPSPAPLVAGLLMLIAGLVALPPSRSAVGAMLGQRLSPADAFVVFWGCFGGAALLNILFS